MPNVSFLHSESALISDGRAAVRSDCQETSLGDQAHKAPELKLDRVKVRIDVRVVELDISDNGKIGKVVEEFGAFVEKGGVVLVPFDNAVRSPFQPVAGFEILGNSADQKIRQPSG